MIPLASGLKGIGVPLSASNDKFLRHFIPTLSGIGDFSRKT